MVEEKLNFYNFKGQNSFHSFSCISDQAADSEAGQFFLTASSDLWIVKGGMSHFLNLHLSCMDGLSFPKKLLAFKKNFIKENQILLIHITLFLCNY